MWDGRGLVCDQTLLNRPAAIKALPAAPGEPIEEYNEAHQKVTSTIFEASGMSGMLTLATDDTAS